MQTTVELSYMQCYKCGVVFAIPEIMRAACERDGSDWYCPNGHGQVYSENIKAKLARTQKQLAQTEFQLNAEIANRKAVQKEMRKLKARVSKGVCPCCHRQFVNMTRHMQTKHPEYVKEGNQPNV